jgi:hypothetical protein
MKITPGIYEVAAPIQFERGAQLVGDANPRATMPTRAEMCADLACAMGWTVQQVGDPAYPLHYQLVEPPDAEPFYHRWRATEADAWADAPNPFTNADDKDALVKWLAEQSPVVWGNFTGCLIDAAIPFHVQPYADWEMVCRAVLTAPLETVAEAAFFAITR